MQAGILHPWVYSESCTLPFSPRRCIARGLSQRIRRESRLGRRARPKAAATSALKQAYHCHLSQSAGIVCYEREEDVANAQRQTDGMHFGGRRLTVK